MTQSEDDTFNRLRRAPYDQVLAEVKRRGAPPGLSFILYNRVYIINQGWDVEEFYNRYQENYFKESARPEILDFTEYDKHYPRSPG